MSDHQPRYRFRGSVEPSAAVKRPVAAHRSAPRAAAGDQAGSKTSSEPVTATIDIFDVIDSYGGWWGISAGEVDAAIKAVGPVDTLYVRLNSPGGEATEGVAIANLLRATKAEVRVTVYGLAASAASLIAVMGDVVNMAPGSMLMIHDAWAFAVGPAEDMRSAAEMLDATSDSYAGVYAAKAGGTTDEWRAVMRNDKWYSADAAVAAKLADAVGIDPSLPANLPPVENDDEDDAVVIELDVNVNQAALAAARRFDLSMLPNAPAALAPQTPAEPPVQQDPHTEEAVIMTPEEIKALRERLGLAEDADVAAINAKLDELEDQATKPEDTKPDLAAAKAALEADGKVVLSQNVLDELRDQAKAGADARAKQLADERDETIAAAVRDGKISRSRTDAWKASWDKDPDGTKADLDSLEARFPVTPTAGFTGHEGMTVGEDGRISDAGNSAVFTDDEAATLGALAGVSGKALQA